MAKGILNRLFGGDSGAAPSETKESAAGVSIAQFVVGQPVMTPRRYDRLTDEAYVRNVIAYRCISYIASTASCAYWRLYDASEKEIIKHPLLDLIAHPNPMRSGAYFFEEMITYLLLAGNSYSEKVTSAISLKSDARELYNLRPDRVQVIPGKNGLPMRYQHECNGVKTYFEVDVITGLSNICHLRKPHPLNDWYGLSPVEPAAYSIDQHNAAGLHNAALLQNSANPSGALIFKGTVDPKKLEALEKRMEEKFSAPKTAGRPMVLGGDFDWKQLGLSPKDLDFNTGKLEVAREICTAFGVPHELIVPGQSTYNNKAEAKLMLWEDTILPMLDGIRDGFFAWLVKPYERGLYFQYDVNDISALAPRRQQQADKTIREWTSGLINRDEARSALGHDKVGKKQGDEYYNANPILGAAPASEPKQAAAPETKALDDLKFIGNELDQPDIIFATTSILSEEMAIIVKKYGQDVIEEIGERAAFEVNAAVQHFIKDSTADLITQINNTTKRMIQEAITEAIANRESITQITDRMTDIFDGDISEYRAQRIATTESTNATGYASKTAMKQSGIESKEWLTTLDNRTRDTHAALDGQIVPVDGLFESPSGDKADHPGGFTDAAENINCRCAIASVFGSAKARTPEERAAMWEQREVKRLDAEKQLVVICRKIFTMQGEAVSKRINQLHHQIEIV